MKKNVLRTYPIKGLVIFLSIVIAVCVALAVTMIIIPEVLALKIVFWVISVVFGVLSLIVLLKEAIVYVSLDDEKDLVIIHEFLIKRKVPLKELSCIENKDGFYVFYQKGKKIYSLGTDRKGANEFILALEAREIKIRW